MAEYIKREAIGKAYMDLCLAKSKLAKSRKGATFFQSDLLPETEPTTKELFRLVMAMPAADVAPVRHGRWVNENKNPVPWDECNSKCPSHSAYCSECGEWLTASDEYPVTGLYCPSCGALMDKEDEHEAD